VRVVSELEPIADLLINIYSRRYNVPADQAKAILAPILSNKDKLKEFEELISRLGMAGEVISKVPEDARGPLITAVAKDLLADEDVMSVDDIKKLAVKLAMYREIIRAAVGDSNSDSKLLDEIKALRQEIENLKASRQSEELKKTILKPLKKLKSRLDELEARLEAASAQPQQTQQGRSALKELASEIKELQDSLNTFIDALKKLGYDIVRPGEREYEIKKTEVDTSAEIRRKLAEAFSDMIKDPDKLDKFLRSISSLFGSRGGQGATGAVESIPTPMSGPPSLSERLSRVGGGKGTGSS